MSDCSTCACRASPGRAAGAGGSSACPCPGGLAAGRGLRLELRKCPGPAFPHVPALLRDPAGHGGQEGPRAALRRDAGPAPGSLPAGGRRHLPAAPEQRPPLPARILRCSPAPHGLPRVLHPCPSLPTAGNLCCDALCDLPGVSSPSVPSMEGEHGPGARCGAEMKS